MYEPTPDEIVWFTEGDCHFFAYALWELTGWPLCCFYVDNEPDLHAFVLHPDGDVVDVKGKRSLDEMAMEWEWALPEEYWDSPHSWIKVAVPWAELRDYFGRSAFGPASKERAPSLARELLTDLL